MAKKIPFTEVCVDVIRRPDHGSKLAISVNNIQNRIFYKGRLLGRLSGLQGQSKASL